MTRGLEILVGIAQTEEICRRLAANLHDDVKYLRQSVGALVLQLGEDEHDGICACSADYAHLRSEHL